MERGRGRGRGSRSVELEEAIAEFRRAQREASGGTTPQSQQGSVLGLPPTESQGGRTRGYPLPSTGYGMEEAMSNSGSGSSCTPGISPVPSDSPRELPASPTTLPYPAFPGMGRGRGYSPFYAASSSGSNSPTPVVITGTLREPETMFQEVGDEGTPMSEEEDLVAQYRRMNVGTAGRVMGRGRGIVVAVSTDETPPSPFPMGRGRGRGRGRGSIFDNMLPIGLPPPSGSPESSGSAPGSLSHSSSNSEVGVEDYSTLENETVVRRGEKGLLIPVTANFVRLGVKKNAGMFEYHVDFEPFLESFRYRRAVMKQHAEAGAISRTRNFDGAKLYLPHRLPRKVTRLTCEHNGGNIVTTIKFVKENRMGDSIHFYNILFRRIMEQLGLLEVNRSFYDYRTSYKLPNHRLEIWPGYVTAIDEAEGGLLLCCDASHRVLRTITLHTVLQEMWAKHRGDDNALQYHFGNYGIGQVVLTKYNNKHYKIDDIDWNQNPTNTFPKKTGEVISYVDYYQIEYGITITDLCQPLLVHKPKEKLTLGNRRQTPPGLVCLIPELCFLTGLSADITDSYKIMKDIGDHTRLSPENRNQALLQFVKKVKGNTDATAMLDSWGLTLEDATVQLQGRQIMAPNLTLNEHLTIQGSSDFSRETSKNHCFAPIAIKHWVVVCPANERDKAANLISYYRESCRNIGIPLASDGAIVTVQAQGHKLKEEYRKTISQYLKNKNLQFIVIIVPRPQDDLYAMIKQLCCVEHPIPSQVILATTLIDAKKLRTIVSKIALQINCKLGGSLWTIRIPLEERIMFVGMDVYHDPKKKSPSVTALVASINRTQTKYYSRILKQGIHQETIDSLRNIFFDALNVFKEECGGWPDRILVFRDGVGDGQLETTKQHEVVQMTDTVKRFCENNPKFSFTVVQKRINCRIFAHDEQTGKLINPLPGTVLDHTVTRRSYFDFFLVSQLVRQGTVSPTHYIVLEDNTNIAPDLIQKFAFATSYMYYNWAGPIRVPAVCQYAHKLAFLEGQYIKAEPSGELNKKLFYL